MAYRNGSRRCCRSLRCRRAGHYPRAYASRDRPARRWVLNPILTTSFEPFPAQLRDRRRRSKLRRKSSRKWRDNLRFQRRLVESTQEILGFPKRPHLPQSAKNSPQNAASKVQVEKLAVFKESLETGEKRGKKEHPVSPAIKEEIKLLLTVWT